MLAFIPPTPPPVQVGYYAIPVALDEPLESVVNPIGMELRSRKRVWNHGACLFVHTRARDIPAVANPAPCCPYT